MDKINNIYIMGGGFKTLKYFGAVRYLFNNNLIHPETNIYCSSAGVLTGIGIILYQLDKAKFEYYVSSLKSITHDLRKNKCKIFGCSDSHFVPLLESIIDDIEPYINKLFISITIFDPFPRNIFVSDFCCKIDLIHAIKTTMHIPYFFNVSLFHKFRNFRFCMDGGITDNCCYLNEEQSLLIRHKTFPFYNTLYPLKETDIDSSDIESNECIIGLNNIIKN